MPSFDIVSKIDMHELSNAVDQANREVETRFDFKGTNAKFELSGEKITLVAQEEFQIHQMSDILNAKLAKRGINVQCLEKKEVQKSLHQTSQDINVRQGIERDLAKKIVKLIKDEKLKVQSAVQGDQVRVTGKKRDDLQSVIALLKEKDVGLPLQYENFRD